MSVRTTEDQNELKNNNDAPSDFLCCLYQKITLSLNVFIFFVIIIYGSEIIIQFARVGMNQSSNY